MLGSATSDGNNSNASTAEYIKVGGVYCNSPDLSGFNPACTYYVTYDNAGTQTGESIPISQTAPDGWYDYSKKKWANVMTNNNGLKTYWTYIPRFKYQIWKELKQTHIRYIKPNITDNNAGEGFMVPDSFTFGKYHEGSKDENGNDISGQDIQLKRYWVSKYRVQDSPADTTIFNG